MQLPVFGGVALVTLLFAPYASSGLGIAVSKLNSLITGGLFFLLGPYVSVTVSRWWSIRKD